jgi:hypothetical protein
MIAHMPESDRVAIPGQVPVLARVVTELIFCMFAWLLSYHYSHWKIW